MQIQQISSGAGGRHNEDLVAVHEHEGCTDIVVLDGATSVADLNYVDDDIGDVAWFARQFSAALARLLDRAMSQQDSTRMALEQVASAYLERARDPVPLYALPQAAMTWVRITRDEDGFLLKLFCLGDCKAFLAAPDGGVIDLDPYQNHYEQVVLAEVARLAEEGVTDPKLRFARLLPTLRARREAQQSSATPSVLCLRPRGALQAREYAVRAGAGSMLIAMTDGFSRAVDTYGICSIEELAGLCREQQLPAILQLLRNFESGIDGTRTPTVKKADDASAITCLLQA